jgi:uncharacterized membrane protein
MSESQQGAESQSAQPQSTESQGIPAVGFLVMAFTAENTADQVLDAMKEAKKQQRFYFEDAAVIRQDANGHVHYKETGDMSTGKGAGVGALVGGILGILGGPAGVALGAGAGAAIGGAMAHGDKGFRNESLNTVGTALMPGSSAIAAITSRDFLKAVREEVPIENIRAAVSNLATELSNQLAVGKDVAIGLILTEEGIAVKKIAADENSAEVVGAVITADAVIAGAAVITAEGAAYQVGVLTAEGAAVEEGVIVPESADTAAAAATAAKAASAAPEAAAPEAKLDAKPEAGDAAAKA